MKTNEVLQKDVQDAIKWEPLLNAAEIGVTAKDGVITLTGIVDCNAKKLEAENAAKKVVGVKALIEKIEIRFSSTGQKRNSEVATEVLKALKDNWKVPGEKIKVKVEDGWVTLEGELPWHYQKEAARNSVNYLMGVKGVTNNITIKSEKNDDIERDKIECALARNWSIHFRDIKVRVSGNKVTLSGIVSSLFDKEEAERIAWNAPGVWSVDNELIIECDYSFVD